MAERVVFDHHGRARIIPDTTGMQTPVRCMHCGQVYDLGMVTVTARYADCSVWITPCCKRSGVDDRLYKGRADIEYLRR